MKWMCGLHTGGMHRVQIQGHKLSQWTNVLQPKCNCLTAFVTNQLLKYEAGSLSKGVVETVANFIFWGSKITADGDCSHEIKRHLLLGRKVMTNLDSILKSRDITLSTKVRLIKVMVFPVVMYGYESWTIKKAENRRIDAFELWC